MASSFMLLKKISFLFLLISASILSTSFAGRRAIYIKEGSNVDVGVGYEGKERETSNVMEASTIHGRLLRVNTKDYGNYDPAPALVKPPFKLIPN